VSNPKKKAAPSVVEEKHETAKPVDSDTQKTEVPTPVVPPSKQETPPENISILPIINSIPENQAKMAEQLGIPIRPIMRWAAAMENTIIAQGNRIIAQGKALEQLGVDLKPLIDAVNQRQNPIANPSIPSSSNTSSTGGTLGQILQAIGPILQATGVAGGGAEGIATKIGEMYLERALKSSMESESMGNWMQKEFFKRTFPSVFAEWEKTNAPVKG
jgi:hypothetical protein